MTQPSHIHRHNNITVISHNVIYLLYTIRNMRNFFFLYIYVYAYITFVCHVKKCQYIFLYIYIINIYNIYNSLNKIFSFVRKTNDVINFALLHIRRSLSRSHHQRMASGK